jgi:flavorubredoxin
VNLIPFIAKNMVLYIKIYMEVSAMNAVKIKENIYWVGAIDWNLRSFHGYITQKGSTYNAYLIIDEKITLIDTVKEPFKKEMLERIRSVIDPSKIDYIVSNHVEPDHSGAIPEILKYAPDAKLFTISPSGAKGLTAYYGDLKNYVAVKTGEELKLGKYSLKFISTPMVHWPDNMFCYLKEEKILFSNDSFGQHYASNERFDDQTPIHDVYFEAEKYYANIVQPYSKQVQKAIESTKDLDISLICPSHGIIWRKNIPEIVAMYKKWSANTREKRAVIVYDTMWHSTEKMAHAIETAFLNKGIPVVLYDLQHNHESDIVANLIGAKYLAVGSSTLNNNMLSSVASFLTYLTGLNGGTHDYIAFGSYGWGGQSPDLINGYLEKMGLNQLLPPIKFNYLPLENDLKDITKKVEDVL